MQGLESASPFSCKTVANIYWFHPPKQQTRISRCPRRCWRSHKELCWFLHFHHTLSKEPFNINLAWTHLKWKYSFDLGSWCIGSPFSTMPAVQNWALSVYLGLLLINSCSEGFNRIAVIKTFSTYTKTLPRPLLVKSQVQATIKFLRMFSQNVFVGLLLNVCDALIYKR